MTDRAHSGTTLLKRIRRGRSGYLFVLPHFLFFAVFFLIPVIWGIYYSFFNYTLFKFDFWGLKGYLRLLKDRYFWISLRNTFYYTAGIVPLWLIKALIISMIWLWIYEPQFGLLNALMRLLHLPTLIWLGNRFLAMPAIIFMQFVMGVGSTIVLVSAALAGIPPSFVEVARLEGASPVQVFTQIYVMTKGGPEFATTTMVYQIYHRAFVNFNLGASLAQSVLMMLILVALAIVQFKWLGGEVEY